MKTKAVLLDFDGVILDSWPIAINLIKYFADKFGWPISEADEEKIRKNWGHRGEKIFKLAFSGKNKDFYQEFYKKWINKEREILESEKSFHKNMPIIEGVIEALCFLKKKGMICGLITNRSANLFPSSPEINKVLEKLDFIQTVDAGEIQLHKNHLISNFFKPDIGAFDCSIKYLKKKGIKPEEITLVEDSLISINPVKGRGLIFVGVCSGPIDTTEKWQEWGKLKPKNILNSIADLPEWLEKHNK